VLPVVWGSYELACLMLKPSWKCLVFNHPILGGDNSKQHWWFIYMNSDDSGFVLKRSIKNIISHFIFLKNNSSSDFFVSQITIHWYIKFSTEHLRGILVYSYNLSLLKIKYCKKIVSCILAYPHEYIVNYLWYWYHVVYCIVGSCILFCMRIDAPATALNW